MSQFYKSSRTLPTPWTLGVDEYAVVPLKNYHIWMLFSNRKWTLFDFVNAKVVKTGELHGKNLYPRNIQGHSSFDGDKVVFCNVSDVHKVEVLDPWTDTYEDGWDLTTPTEGAVASNQRNDVNVMNDAVNNILAFTFQATRKYVLFERRANNNELLVTVAAKGAKNQSAVFQPKNDSGTWYPAAGDESGKVVLYSDTVGTKIAFAIWDTSKSDGKFETFEIETGITGTVIQCGGWGDNTLAFTGNFDGRAPPTWLHVNVKDQKCVVKDLDSEAGFLQDTFIIDGKNTRIVSIVRKKKVCYLMSSEKSNVAIEQDNSAEDIAVSADQRYYVQYDGCPPDDEDENKSGNMKVQCFTMSSRRMFVLHVLQKAKIKDGSKNLNDYYSNPKLVQSMICDFLGH